MQQKRIKRALGLFALMLAASACNAEYAFLRVETVGERAFLFGHQSFRSADSGATWSCLDTPWETSGDYAPHFGRLQFSLVGDRHLFVSFRGRLFRSTDAGDTWNGLEIDAGVPGGIYNRLYFFAADRGLARFHPDGSLGSRVFWTRDGGRSWVPVEGVTALQDADHDGERVIILDAFGTVRQSLDRGESWEAVGQWQHCHSLRLLGEEIWLLGDGGFCRRHNLNSGEEAPCGIRTGRWIFDMAAHGRSLLAGASDGRLFVSTDGGTTWMREDLGTEESLVSVAFFDNGTAIAAGGRREGTIPIPHRIAVISKGLRRWERIRFPSCP